MSPLAPTPAASTAAIASSTRRSSSRRAPSRPSDPTRVRLVLLGVLARAFAERRRVAFDVENVVGDLKRGADCAPVSFKRRTRFRPRSGEPRPRLDAEFEQRAGLHRLQASDLLNRKRRRRLLGVDIKHLAAHHAREAGGSRKPQAERDAHLRDRVGRRIGEDLERQRLQSVSGENRRRLVEGAVGRSGARVSSRHRPSTADRRGSTNRRGCIRSPRPRAPDPCPFALAPAPSRR